MDEIPEEGNPEKLTDQEAASQLLLTLVRDIVKMSKALEAHRGVVERIAWMIAQDYAGDYLSNIDPRLIMPKEEIQRRCDDIVTKVQQFIYYGDMEALTEASKSIAQERNARKLIV